MEIPVMFIFTHDSIGLGEDGPTHQPVEQLAAFRAMPNMLVFRPGDANEVTEAYKAMLEHAHGPSTLVLSRQGMPTLDRTKYAAAAGVAKGAYVLADAAGGKPEVILMATGSELGSLCRPEGQEHRDALFRSLGPVEGCAEEIRVRGRCRGSRGQTSVGQVNRPVARFTKEETHELFSEGGRPERRMLKS